MWFFSNSKRLSELWCVCTCTGSAHLPPPPPPKVDGPWWCSASSAWRQSNGCFSCKHLKRNSNEKRLLLLLLQLVYEHLTLTRGRTENVKSTNATAAAVVDGNGNGESACKKRRGKNKIKVHLTRCLSRFHHLSLKKCNTKSTIGVLPKGGIYALLCHLDAAPWSPSSYPNLKHFSSSLD